MVDLGLESDHWPLLREPVGMELGLEAHLLTPSPIVPVWDVEGELEDALSEWPRVNEEHSMPLYIHVHTHIHWQEVVVGEEVP